jgi:hypothetical protein
MMDKYIEAEKRLAELLGWKGIIQLGECLFGSDNETPPNPYKSQAVPQWCRDNSAVFELMVEHGCWPHETGGRILVGGWDGYVIISDHPDKKTAVRMALVQALISRLEANRG